MNFSLASRASAGRFTATGVILHSGGWTPISLNWPMLILDARSLARAWIARLGKAATGAGLAGNPDLAVALARQAAALEAWLRDPQVSVAAWPELAMRQAVPPITVDRMTLPAYAAALVERSLPQDYAVMGSLPRMEFFLETERAVLSVTRRGQVLARHAGADVCGEVVSQADLEDRITVALQTAAKS